MRVRVRMRMRMRARVRVRVRALMSPTCAGDVPAPLPAPWDAPCVWAVWPCHIRVVTIYDSRKAPASPCAWAVWPWLHHD